MSSCKGRKHVVEKVTRPFPRREPARVVADVVTFAFCPAALTGETSVGKQGARAAATRSAERRKRFRDIFLVSDSRRRGRQHSENTSSGGTATRSAARGKKYVTFSCAVLVGDGGDSSGKRGAPDGQRVDRPRGGKVSVTFSFSWIFGDEGDRSWKRRALEGQRRDRPQGGKNLMGHKPSCASRR